MPRTVAQSVTDGTQFTVWKQSANGLSAPQAIGALVGAMEAVYSPDGRWIIMRMGTLSIDAQIDLAVARVADDGTLEEVQVISTPANERSVTISPDGRWLAYESDETGRVEICIRSFPDLSLRREQVSGSGGVMPVWGRTGKELFFVNENREMVAVGVTLGANFEVGAFSTLFSIPENMLFSEQDFYAQYDVDIDDQRFMMLRRISDPPLPRRSSSSTRSRGSRTVRGTEARSDLEPTSRKADMDHLMKPIAERVTSVAIVTATALVVSLGLAPSLSAQTYDVVIRGGTIVDGTGEARYRADLGIVGDRIVRISREGIAATEGRTVIDATGRVVTPGFVDNHSHTQESIAHYPLAENFLRQGITTLVASLHSGDQPSPLDAWASSIESAPNMAYFAGHTWTRQQVLGMDDRDPTPEELERMKALVAQSMREGAMGLATGLLYVPANYAKTEEVIELAKVAAAYGGIYVSHMRGEGAGLIESVAEVIRIADEAKIPAQINHHKAAGAGQWGWSERTLAMIDSANAAGLTVVHDLYPYAASSTGSSILFPQWSLAGGEEAFAARVADPETRERMEADMRVLWDTDRGGSDLSLVQFRVVPSDPSYNGKRLSDYAADRGFGPMDQEAGIDLAIGLQLKGGFSAIYHIMDEADVVRIMQHPLAMIETDGDNVGFGVGFPHPRSYGAFARVLGRYVREMQVITLEEAVKKMTSMPAHWIGQMDRGVIAEGMLADVAVFDPEVIADRATYTDPHQYSVGIEELLVNGVPVIRGGALTGEKPGRWLRGPVRKGIS